MEWNPYGFIGTVVADLIVLNVWSACAINREDD